MAVEALTGNAACAAAMRQIEPDVVAAYPITPSTEVVELFSQFVSDGKVRTEFVAVESEHSAMSACIGASSAGARVMTATSSQGLMLMSELLFVASGMRLPIIVANATRALSAPLNIHGDHSDAMAVRDSGWIQIFCQDGQELYDTMIQAVKIAEFKQVSLPVMVCFDGFSLSHTLERVNLLDNDQVREFVGERVPVHSLLGLKPITLGPVDLPNYYTEHKRQQAEAMKRAGSLAIPQVQKEFFEKFGRGYDSVESYCLEDADVALVLLGASAGAAKESVDHLRKHGVRAGLLVIRVFRPFPYALVRQCLELVQAVAVLDRMPVFGGYGPLYQEIITALFAVEGRPRCASFIGGLGGRDLTAESFRKIFMAAEKMAGKDSEESEGVYFDVREGDSLIKKLNPVP